ncbi:MAG: GTPase [Thermoprotei archaeon]|nr:MAG: GTPase [Thermoprotei archaeon]
MYIRKVIIMGAGGRDFHNFNIVFRNNPNYKVIAFTAAQIPGIEMKRYPPSLAGSLYPSGIPIYPEEKLVELIKLFKVDEVVLSYSDLTYEDIGRKLSMVLAAGATFKILGPDETMIPSFKPVIAITAVRTGAGKSTVSRAVIKELLERGIKPAIVRHPMAYGDLERAIVQIFENIKDFDKYGTTIEEREEYEPYVKMGLTVLAGVDYEKVLLEAEKRGDVILWDGGNNDWPFFRPNYMITVADAMRPGQEIYSFPGEVNVRMANAVIVNKISQAKSEDVNTVVRNIKAINPKAHIVKADMEVYVEKPSLISGKKVVIVEDSPSVTHGRLPYGAGYVAAKKYNVSEIVDPRPYAKGIIKKMYEEYPHMGPVIPSTGYTLEQLRDLENTLNAVDADVIILGTPADITRLINVNKPVIHVKYELKVLEGPSIAELIEEFLEKVKT